MDETLSSSPLGLLNWESGTLDEAARRGPVPVGEMAAPGALPSGRMRGRLQALDSPARVGEEAHTRFLHVAEQGTMLRKVKGRLRVMRQGQTLVEVQGVKLQGVVLYGNIQVTTQCMRYLMQEGIWLSFFTRQGQYKGRIQPPVERGGRLRLRQWELSRDLDFRMRFSRAVVRGKILAAQRMAGTMAKNRLAASLGEGHRTLREAMEKLEDAATLDQLRGIEGMAARAWWDLFARWNLSELPFEGREKRGAQDPVNLLLNFGYTMVTRELDGLVESAGLDPTIGFYHDAGDDRPALACDLVEEFRHEVVDRLVLRLINLKIIQVDDFEDDEDRGLRLGPAGMRKFLTHYEKALRGGMEDDGIPAARRAFLGQLGRLLDAMGGEAYVSYPESAGAAA